MDEIIGHEGIHTTISKIIEGIIAGSIQLPGPKILIFNGRRGCGKRSAILEAYRIQNDTPPPPTADGEQAAAERMGLFPVTPLTTISDIRAWYDAERRIMPCVLLSYFGVNEYLTNGNFEPPADKQGRIIAHPTNWLKNLYWEFAAKSENIYFIMTVDTERGNRDEIIHGWFNPSPGRFTAFNSDYEMDRDAIVELINRRGILDEFTDDHIEELYQKNLTPGRLIALLDDIVVNGYCGDRLTQEIHDTKQQEFKLAP